MDIELKISYIEKGKLNKSVIKGDVENNIGGKKQLINVREREKIFVLKKDLEKDIDKEKKTETERTRKRERLMKVIFLNASGRFEPTTPALPWKSGMVP